MSKTTSVPIDRKPRDDVRRQQRTGRKRDNSIDYTPRLTGVLAARFDRLARAVADVYDRARRGGRELDVLPGSLCDEREKLFRCARTWITRTQAGTEAQRRIYVAVLLFLRDLLRIEGAYCVCHSGRLTVTVPASPRNSNGDLRCRPAASLAARDRALTRIEAKRELFSSMEEDNYGPNPTLSVRLLVASPRDLAAAFSRVPVLRRDVFEESEYLGQAIQPYLQPVWAKTAEPPHTVYPCEPPLTCPTTRLKIEDIYTYFRLHYAEVEEVNPGFSMAYLAWDYAQGCGKVMGLVELASPRPEVVEAIEGIPDRVRASLLQVVFCEAIPPYDCIGAREIIGQLLVTSRVVQQVQGARRALFTSTPDAPHAQRADDGVLVALVHDTPMLEADSELRPTTAESPFRGFAHNCTFSERPARIQEPRTKRCCPSLSTETLEALYHVAGIRQTPVEYGFSQDTEKQRKMIRAALDAMLLTSPDPKSTRGMLFPSVAFARSRVVFAPGFDDYLCGDPQVPAYSKTLSLPQSSLVYSAVVDTLIYKAPRLFGSTDLQPCPLLDVEAMERSVAAFTLP